MMFTINCLQIERTTEFTKVEKHHDNKTEQGCKQLTCKKTILLLLQKIPLVFTQTLVKSCVQQTCDCAINNNTWSPYLGTAHIFQLQSSLTVAKTCFLGCRASLLVSREHISMKTSKYGNVCTLYNDSDSHLVLHLQNQNNSPENIYRKSMIKTRENCYCSHPLTGRL